MLRKFVLAILFVIAAAACSSGAHAASCTLPYTFNNYSPGGVPQPINAAQLNADLQALAKCTGNGSVDSANGVPAIASTSALAAKQAHTGDIWVRTGYYVQGDAPPLYYVGSASACSLNAGLGDGGLQVAGASNTCWTGLFSGQIFLSQYGVSATASTALNNQTAFNAATAAAFTTGINSVKLDAVGTLPVNADLRVYPYMTLEGNGVAGCLQQITNGEAIHTVDAVGHSSAQAIVERPIIRNLCYDMHNQIGSWILQATDEAEVSHVTIKNFGSGTFVVDGKTLRAGGVNVVGNDNGSFHVFIHDSAIFPFAAGKGTAITAGYANADSSVNALIIQRVIDFDPTVEDTPAGPEYGIFIINGNDLQLYDDDMSFATTGVQIGDGLSDSTFVERLDIRHLYAESNTCSIQWTTNALAIVGVTFNSTSGSTAECGTRPTGNNSDTSGEASNFINPAQVFQWGKQVGEVLLNTTSLGGAAVVTFGSPLPTPATGVYVAFRLECSNVQMSADSSLVLRTMSGTVNTGAHYEYALSSMNATSTTVGGSAATTATAMFLTNNNAKSGTSFPLAISATILNADSTSVYKPILVDSFYRNVSGQSEWAHGWGWWVNDSSAVTGIQLHGGTGDAATLTGTCRLYGKLG